ncbi:MAG: PAC2 family protein [archaeon]
MKIILNKKPKAPKIIQGFPGFGLIGTITTEFLIEHLNAVEIGSFHYDELPAIIAIHGGKLVNPMGVFYDEKNNIVILHTILNTQGVEWHIGDSIIKMAHALECPEIISLEGVSSQQTNTNERVFFYTTKESAAAAIEKLGAENLKESIILGVSGAIMLRSHLPITCIFAETNVDYPDSKAASNIIKILDGYLGLKVDYMPLLARAKEYEGKVKDILQQSSIASKIRDKKQLSYVG